MTQWAIWCCVVLALFAPGPGYAQAAETPKEDFEKMLFESVYGEDPKLDLIVQENRLYVDLKRELARVRQDQQRKDVLEIIQAEVAAKLTELETLRETLSKEVGEQSEANENLKLVIALLEALKPDQAAGLLKQMPMHVSLATMRMMGPRKASKILSAMEPKFAAEVSRRLIHDSPTKEHP